MKGTLDSMLGDLLSLQANITHYNGRVGRAISKEDRDSYIAASRKDQATRDKLRRAIVAAYDPAEEETE